MALREEESGMGLDAALGLSGGICRRRLLQTALWLVGASATGVPFQALAEAVTAGKQYFDPARFAVLDAVAETIMPRTDTPGARDAGIPPQFDAMMITWASEERRAAFGAILDAIDQSARSEHVQGFASASAQQQLTSMAAYDTAQFGDPQYRAFKQLILTLYYMSEPGATQELRYEHTPGVWVPSLEVTPDTRAWAVDLALTSV